jgi:formylglycine-generating enzyme required for sulfatase activity/tRNA A-37 threonylcarbamoyl transferase component Bud32
MAITSADGLVDLLRRTRLLDPARLVELNRGLKAHPSDARALAGELIRRGWLTPYQINQLFQGRTDDLILGHYLLLERLGEGGMGQVFKARETRLGRIVALKVLRKERITKPETLRRFHKEIEATARLSHPNIVHAYDAEPIGDALVYAMEYVEGIDLARLVQKSGPLPVTQACEYVRQAALGLQHIHEHGMVHRDIKPANLMRAGPEGIIKILDMGLARWLDENAGDQITKLTRLGTVMGTIDYLAPEQALNARRADIRSDLYSLGCTFYFLLTGRVPFPTGEPMAKLLAHQCDPPPPVQELRPDVPPHVAALIARLMAKHPDDRPQTPAELALELASRGVPEIAPPLASGGLQPPQCAESQGAEAPRSQATPLASRRRGKFWIAAVVVIFAPLLTGLLVYLFRGGRQPAPKDGAADTSGATLSGSVLTNSLGMKLVRIPAGSFFMGSTANEPNHRRDEEPSHQVTITQPFYLGMYLVTVGDFRAFVRATRDGGEGSGGSWRDPGWEQTDEHPVACVSWHDARAFCGWLSQKEHRTYRLPREAEWEYACRASSTAAYCYGPDPKKLHDYAWYRDNAGERAHPVGRLKPNRWGLFDMHGNLLQWCDDYYDAGFYQKVVLEDPQGPARGGRRVLRGASWNSTAADCRSARRGASQPAENGNDRGFRVVLVLPEQ